MMKRPAWIVAFTIKHAQNVLEDRWSIYPTRKDAEAAYNDLILAPTVYCASYGQMKGATEPHWMTGEVG